ncbi:MAG TPA: alpha-amylase family glycosyl hydrolase [Myxococcota bacterium]|nr:alpha-amylase family glycosyl hydrolase [Myxococcota bacterium]
MSPPVIYNLFPRLAGRMDGWTEHAERARLMGFNWIYLNPVTQPGFSGSLYAVKDHYTVCPDFLPASASTSGIDELREVLGQFRSLGLRPSMDLVINHTAIDCPLVTEHPEWYLRNENGKVVHPSAIDPADARKVTVWGDLAEIDNAESPDLDGLWDYWVSLVRFYVELGFEGFRCDAAYKVPALLWRVLADEARELNERVTFFAETLGCRLAEVRALGGAGLDYLFNSSKYWNFDAPWALEQHESFGALAPSVSFPESHDTQRLFAETEANLAVMRQRYLLAALFSEGVMMPVGYEYGFSRRLNVVKTRPDDWEQTQVDLSSFIAAVNRVKIETPIFGCEGHWRALGPYDQPTIVIEKSSASERALVLVNKDWHAGRTIDLQEIRPEAPGGASLHRLDEQGRLDVCEIPAWLEMRPAEIAWIA